MKKINKKKNELLKKLSIIFDEKIKITSKIVELQNFDSIVILQIIGLAKTKYKKNIDGQKISSCKTISEIINLLS